MSHPTNPTPSGPTASQPVTVSCVDAVGRTRQPTVITSRGRTVLRTPPGEVAVLDPAGANRLAGILHTAGPGDGRSGTAGLARP